MVLNPIDPMFLYEDDVGGNKTKHTSRENSMDDGGRDYNDASVSQEIPRTSTGIQKLGEQYGTNSPSVSAEGTYFADTWISDF